MVVSSLPVHPEGLGCGVSRVEAIPYQFSLFGWAPEFEASPVSLIVGPHPGIKAAVVFPIPLAHLGEASERVTCRALLGLENGGLLVVEFPQSIFGSPEFWEKTLELRLGVRSFKDEVQRCGALSIGSMRDLDAWPFRGYARSRQFDCFCESLSVGPPLCSDSGAEREIAVARASALLQDQLKYAVDALLAVLAVSASAHERAGPDVRAIAQLVEARGDLPVNLWSDLQTLPLAAKPDGRKRLGQSLRDWPLPLLHATLWRDPLARALQCSIETGSSLVAALAGAKVSRPVIRRAMRLGRNFPRMDAWTFRRTLLLASTLPADAVPEDPLRWQALADLQREARWVHRSLDSPDALSRLCQWCWFAAGDAPGDHLQCFSNALRIIVGRPDASVYINDEVVEVADLLLAWPPGEVRSILQRVREAARELREEAIARGAVRLGWPSTDGLLEHLLARLPDLPSRAGSQGSVFALARQAGDLLDCGTRLGNCLSRPATCVDFMLSEELIFIIRSSQGTPRGALALEMAGGTEARVGQFQVEGNCASIEDAQAVATWLSEKALQATDFTSFRDAVKCAGEAVMAEFQAMDRMKAWRTTLKRSPRS